MEQYKIDRINELARKARTAEGLTPAELAEREALRREYIDAHRQSLIRQLENTYGGRSRRSFFCRAPGGRRRGGIFQIQVLSRFQRFPDRCHRP